MFNMKTMSSELYAATPYFKSINPGILSLPIKQHQTIVRGVKAALVGIGAYKTYKSGKSAAHITGDVIGGRIIKLGTRPVKAKMTQVHVRASQIPSKDLWRKNGMGARGWINTPGRHQMVMVFHDANRVGPHIDVHIGRLSMVYRVKPELYSQLKFNRDGMLTENSRNLLLQHVRNEVQNGSRVPQNLDHSLSNGRASWTGGDPNASHYGAGTTRQVFHESTVDVYKAGPGHPIEFYAPAINPHRGVYIHRLYDGGGKTAPILIFGARKSAPPNLDDRLHLRLTHPEEALEKLDGKVDWSTTTSKYDGASCYVVITDKGTQVWSPRTSVKTGEQIEYTPKLGSLASTVSKEGTIVAMGEILFREKSPWWDLRPNRSPYLPAATVGGILNSNAVLDDRYEPEIRLYRVDKIGRTKTGDLSFWNNRVLQEEVALLHPTLQVVELMSPKQTQLLGYEGYVVIPKDGSVNDGFKVKYWQDANDWCVMGVEFEYGGNGGIAGVVRFRSLDSGRDFKLGSSSVGNRELAESMLNHPEDYIGTVFKVASREGHEGRAAKVVSIHNDKGFAPV